MTELNLLQNSAKRQLETTTCYIQVINGVVFLSIILTVISIILFASKSYLNFKTSQLTETAITSTENQSITKINNVIYQVDVIQRDYIKWSRVLINFFNLIPENNQIKNLSFNKADKLMTLSGHADSRDAFLELKNNLENSDLITEVDSPISNLLHQDDFNFSLSAKLKL